MNSPIKSLKRLPWLQIFQVAALTLLLAIAIDTALLWLALNLPSLRQFFVLLDRMGQVLTLLVGLGMGSLGVYLWKRLQSDVRLTAGCLWGLVACITLLLWLKSLLPLTSFLVRPSYLMFIGTLVGASWAGRESWQTWWR